MMDTRSISISDYLITHNAICIKSHGRLRGVWKAPTQAKRSEERLGKTRKVAGYPDKIVTCGDVSQSTCLSFYSWAQEGDLNYIQCMSQ